MHELQEAEIITLMLSVMVQGANKCVNQPRAEDTQALAHGADCENEVVIDPDMTQARFKSSQQQRDQILKQSGTSIVELSSVCRRWAAHRAPLIVLIVVEPSGSAEDKTRRDETRRGEARRGGAERSGAGRDGTRRDTFRPQASRKRTVETVWDKHDRCTF